MRFIILILLAGIFYSNNALACSCRAPSLKEKIADSSVILSGIVTEVKGESGGRCGSKQATMKVTNQWKGNSLSQVTLVTGDACMGCGMYLQSGTTYLIYGGEKDGKIGTYMCSGSGPIQQAQDEVKELTTYFQQAKSLDKAINANKNDVNAYLTKVDYFLSANDYAQAIDLLKKTAKLPESQNNVATWKKLGQAYEGMRDSKNAALAYQQALVIAPKDLSIKQSLQRSQLLSGVPLEQIFIGKNAENFDFSGITLEGLSITGLNLKNANFSNATLKNITFSNVSLENAHFQKTTISDTRFDKSILLHSQWHESRLDNIVFNQNNMDGVVFYDVSVLRSSFQDMDINNLTLKRGYFDASSLENIRFSHAIIEMQSFKGLKAKNIHFSHANITNVNAYDAILVDSDFSLSTIQSLSIPYSDLAGTKFEHSTLITSQFNQSVLDGAKFIDVDLTDSSFYAASLKGTKFNKIITSPLKSSIGVGEQSNRNGDASAGKTNFFMSIYDCSTQWSHDIKPSEAGAVLVDGKCQKNLKPLDFHGATIGTFGIVHSGSTEGDHKGRSQNFKHAIMPNANMQKVRFYGISLENANLRHADLSGAIIYSSSIKGANLSGANLKGASFLLTEYDCATKWPEGFDYGAVGAISTDSKCTKPTDLRQANFLGVNAAHHDFQKANMEGLRFDRNDFQHSNFSDANMSWILASSVNFEHSQFNNTNFTHANLSGASFVGSTLKKAVLDGALFNGTNFTNLDMQGTNHKNRKMKAAILQASHFESSNFENADLERSELQKANFNFANLKNANLRFVTLQIPKFDSYRISYNAVQTHMRINWSGQDSATFAHADLSHADLSFAYLGNVDFSTANLTGTKLILAKFGCEAKWPKDFSPTAAGAVQEEPCEKAHYDRTNLSGEDLSHSYLGGYDLSHANLKDADLSYAILDNANFSDADFNKTKLLFTRYSCVSTIFPKGFDPSKYGAIANEGTCKDKKYSTPNFAHHELQGENLGQLSLVGVDFSQSDLQQASFERSDLSKANLQKTKLQGVNFYGVSLFEARLKDAEYDCLTQWPNDFDPVKAGAVKKDGECKEKKETFIQQNIRDLLHDTQQQHDAKGLNFSNKNLSGRFFSSVDLSYADFSHSNLEWSGFNPTVVLLNANFSGANLRGANVWGDLHNAVFDGADLTHATFSTSLIEGISLKNAILKNTRFSDYTGIEKIDLTGAKYDCRTFWGSNNPKFDPRTRGAILDDKPCNPSTHIQ